MNTDLFRHKYCCGLVKVEIRASSNDASRSYYLVEVWHLFRLFRFRCNRAPNYSTFKAANFDAASFISSYKNHNRLNKTSHLSHLVDEVVV